MRICLISEEYPPETGWGGIGTYTHSASRGYAAAGCDVHVVTRTWEQPGHAVEDGVHVHRILLPEPRWRRGTRHLTMKMWETRHVAEWARQVTRTVATIHEQTPLDVVEAPEYHAQASLVRLRRPRPMVAVRLHGPSQLCRQLNRRGVGGSAADTLLAEWAERRLVRRADTVTAPSRAMADYMERWGIPRPAVVAHPFEAGPFVSAARATVPSGRSILFCGRVQPLKGIDALIEALPRVLARCPEVVVRVAGDDHPSGPDGTSMTHHLQRRAAQLNVQHAIDWMGLQPRACLPKLYAESLVAVVPSLWETFSFTCVEAMASARGVVVSDAGALPELVSHQTTGLVVPPSDPHALADALVGLLENPSHAMTLGAAAQAWVLRELEPTAVAKQLVDHYATGRGPR